jgi:hypothetical protein
MPRRAVEKRIAFPRTREWEYLEGDGVTVSTCGVPREFREAFLRIFVESRAYYRRMFGTSAIGWVEFNVRKGNGLPLRLWTNGADRAFLTLSKKGQLEPPSLSGIRHMYGLPHELGHIVLYRSLINVGVLADGWGEGWAVYLSSFLAVPHLYKKFGPELWPYPYDYLATEGPGRFLKVFKATHNRNLGSCFACVRTLHQLEQQLGRAGFGRFFRSLLKTPIRADRLKSEVEKKLTRR